MGGPSRVLSFTAEILQRGVNPFVPVSPIRSRRLRSEGRGPLPVLLRINGGPTKAWRTNLMPDGHGGFLLYLHGPARRGAGVRVGDRVRISIELDRRYRGGPQHRMPPTLRAGLARVPSAARHWSALVPSRKKEVLRYLARLRGSEARARNIALTLRALSGARVRFLGQEWIDGR
ncbi:MAG TPA: DUF1905 domain-containing protein [Thermoplasmata archaeon]|nr:DUF1905 domain-containing protein [Thermoplasmata archaeon]